MDIGFYVGVLLRSLLKKVLFMGSMSFRLKRVDESTAAPTVSGLNLDSRLGMAAGTGLLSSWFDRQGILRDTGVIENTNYRLGGPPTLQ